MLLTLNLSFYHQSYNLWFSSSYGAGFDGASLVEPCEYLGDTSVGDEELSGDVAGSDPHQSQLYYPPPHIVRQRSTIDKDSSKLINSGLTLLNHKSLICLRDFPQRITFNIKTKNLPTCVGHFLG